MLSAIPRNLGAVSVLVHEIPDGVRGEWRRPRQASRPFQGSACRGIVFVFVLMAVFALSISSARAANEVALENSLPGTSDWGLTNPATGRQIEGYASATSVNRGDPISLYVSTAAPSFRIEVFRMGWYQGLGARRVAGPITVAGGLQPVPAPDPATGLVDANWTASYVLQTRDAASGAPWSTGVYLARLTESAAGKQSYIIFVVRDDAQKPDILFQLPVTTYQAYNFWGGKSLYGWGSGSALPWGSTSGTAATKVSFNRPYAGSTNPAAAYGIGAGEFLTNVQPVAQGYPISSAGWDYNMVRWLEKEQYNVGYITSIDTGRSASRVANTKIFMSQGHDEYWTSQMRSNVEAARDAGVNLAFFSGNTAYWQIRLEPSPATGAADRVIVEYRTAAADPYSSDGDPTNDQYTTVRFRDAPVSRPEAAMKGNQYILDPFDGDLIVTNAAHWVFAGTGLANQDRLPGLLGYEVDGVAGSSPANTVTLTSTPVAAQPSGQPSGSSQMTIYTAASGAQVFSTGSIQWSWGLDDFNAPALRTSRSSAAAATITRNVLDEFGASPGASTGVSARCVRLKALSEINGNPWTSAAEIGLLDTQGQALPKTGWTVAGVDSQELVGEDGRATNAIDGNTATFWHTQWQGANPPPPHNIDIDLGSQQTLTGLQYLPRQDTGVNGTIAGYQVFVSPQCTGTWTEVSQGTWAANKTLKTATFSAGGNVAPTVTIASPSDGASFTTNDTVAFSGSATDLEDGDVSASLAWSSSIDGPLGNGASVNAKLSAGTHTITATATDSGGLSSSRSVTVTVTAPGVSARCVRLKALSEINGNPWTSAAEIGLLDTQGQALPKTGWTVAGVDSQELVGEDGRATNAIDGNTATFWHTQWQGANPPPPHNIDIDLGSQQTLTGLQYLPRQDTGVNGTIAGYQVFVSPQCTGTWTEVSQGTWAANKTLKTATFSAGGNVAPTVTIASPSDGASFTTNDTVAFSGSATDLEDGDVSASLAWSSSIDGPLGNGASVNAKLSAGTHTITATATDSGGLSSSRSVTVTVTAPGVSARCVRLKALSEINGNPWTSAAEIGLLDTQGQALPKTGWTVAGVDSQELVGEDGRATNAIDGNTATFWHTQWQGANPPPPHNIDIDLGSQQTLTGLQYLPRQDTGVNGTIAGYQVFVSPQCTGTWTEVSQGTWAANKTLKTATFQQ